MRILVATPFMVGHYDAGLFWVRALCNMGHSVYLWDYRLQVDQPKVEADMTLAFKAESVDVDNLPHPRVCYWPDDPERTPGIAKILEKFDKIFTLVKPTPNGMIWIPSGWEPLVHWKVKVPHPEAFDVVYIGTKNSPYKKDMVTSIGVTHVFGNEWRPEDFKMGSISLGPPQYLHDFTYVANMAKILVCIHQSPTVGPNRKLFEMMACGFTLVDRVPGVEEILGQELTKRVGFRTTDEARELIRFYLDRPEEREKIWQVERRAIEPYTYENAARRLLKCTFVD